MDIHYNAFISYRHHPDDIRVASQIHRMLEHYKVPRAIRKQTKGITRLFRDKEELPITSNLTDDITRALENSDYLIVICSTHTRESTWVQREIETFLKTHDRNKVLTVLVNGEPYETIPEILLSEEQVDPVTGEVKLVPIEPLSCDWRIGLRRAKREELPRLAAALLNCGYNELRQRERQYRTRRMIAAFSTALAISLSFMAYFIYSNMQIQQANEQLQEANERIQENLNQALENQSMFLGNEALQLLDDGDRLTAIALALEALPQYEGERPYVATAEYALSQAVGAYNSTFNVAAIGAMDCGALVRDFVVTDDGATVYIRDARDVVTVWDAATFRQLGSAALNFSPTQMMVTGSGNVLVYENFGQLACCDRNGNILWSDTNYDDVAFLNDKATLMLLSSETAVYGEPYQCTIRFLDPDTGKESRAPLEFTDPNGTTRTPHFLQRFHRTGDPVALGFSGYSSDYAHEYVDIHLLDINTGSCTFLTALEDRMVNLIGYTADGNLLVMTPDTESTMQGIFLDMVTTQEATGALFCFNIETGAQIWQTPITSYVYTDCRTLETLPGSTDLMLQYDNVFHIIDSLTGEILTRCESTARPLWVKVKENNTAFVLENGSYGIFQYDSGTCSAIQYMADNLFTAVNTDGVFYAFESLQTSVIAYAQIKDDDFHRFEGDYNYIYPSAYAASGNIMALESFSGIHVFDTQTQSLLWADTSEEYTSDLHILGFSEDGNKLFGFFDDYSAKKLITYNATTGTAKSTALPDSIDGGTIYILDNYLLYGTDFYFIAENFNTGEWILLRQNVISGDVDWWAICKPQEKDYYIYAQAFPLAACDTHVLVWENTTESIYEIELATGKVRTVLTEVSSFPMTNVYSDTEYLLAVNNEILLRSFGSDVQSSFAIGDKKAGAFHLYQDQILALCDDGRLYRYSKDGTQLSFTELELYTSFYSSLETDPNAVRWFDTVGGDLIIDVGGYGNMVDVATWQVRASMPNFIAYDPVRDVIIEFSESVDVNGIIAYPRYSTEEIMTKAQEALKDFELTDDQKVAYGLLEND